MKIRVKVHLNVHGVSQVRDWEEKNKQADKYEILDFGLYGVRRTWFLQGHIQSNDNVFEPLTEV
jgi:hypothetical protein